MSMEYRKRKTSESDLLRESDASSNQDSEELRYDTTVEWSEEKRKQIE